MRLRRGGQSVRNLGLDTPTSASHDARVSPRGKLVRAAGIWLFSCGLLACPPEDTSLRLLRISPSQVPGGRHNRAVLWVKNLPPRYQVVLSRPEDPTFKRVLKPEVEPQGKLELDLPPLPRGAYLVSLNDQSLPLRVQNTPPKFEPIAPIWLRAGAAFTLAPVADDFDGDQLRIELQAGSGWRALGPGRARLQTSAADVGRRFSVRAVAFDGRTRVAANYPIELTEGALPLFLEALHGPDRAEPSGPGGRTFPLTLHGAFTPGDAVMLDGVRLRSSVRSFTRMTAQVPPKGRGLYSVWVERGAERTEARPLRITNALPRIEFPEQLRLSEETHFSRTVIVTDLDADPLSVFMLGLPPGARFDAATKTLFFRPDFIQGGARHRAQIVALDGHGRSTRSVELVIEDTIRPPEPIVVKTERKPDHLRLLLEQRTDAFLGPPQGQERFEARVSVPTRASASAKLPVRVYLHGLGGAPYKGGKGDQFRIYPHDPQLTYWWGQKNGAGQVAAYTQRRVLHLIEWLLRRYPGADPERVYVFGSSMGGAGAASLGLLRARHFAMAEATLAQLIPKNHRPSRKTQLSQLWGPPRARLLDARAPIPTWDYQDLTRALQEEPDSRQQLLLLRHAKDDPVIHFGAVVHPSPLTKMTMYQTLQRTRTAHLAVWDEGAHGPKDPILGPQWWNEGWSPISDPITFVRRDLALVAFSQSSVDQDPGDGRASDRRPFNPERGYAGQVEVPNDTGWSGARAGALNRFLRWDSRAIEDTLMRFSVPLFFKRSGKSLQGDWTGDTILARVTPRRLQRFRCSDGEQIRWRYGAQEGTLRCQDGTVTTERLPIQEESQRLVLERP